jgi:hypothetical protein
MFDGLGYSVFNGYRESAKGKVLGMKTYPRAEEFVAKVLEGYETGDNSNLMTNAVGYGIVC